MEQDPGPTVHVSRAGYNEQHGRNAHWRCAACLASMRPAQPAREFLNRCFLHQDPGIQKTFVEHAVASRFADDAEACSIWGV